jgi:hypothetical protein
MHQKERKFSVFGNKCWEGYLDVMGGKWKTRNVGTEGHFVKDSQF